MLWMFLCNVLLLLGTTGKPSDMFPAGNMSSTTDTTGITLYQLLQVQLVYLLQLCQNYPTSKTGIPSTTMQVVQVK